VFVEPIEAVVERIDQLLGNVRLARDFTGVHSLIRHTLDEHELRRLKPRDAPSYGTQLFKADNPVAE
jgi:hypothetical protein